MATRPQITDEWEYGPPRKRLAPAAGVPQREAAVAEDDWEYSRPNGAEEVVAKPPGRPGGLQGLIEEFNRSILGVGTGEELWEGVKSIGRKVERVRKDPRGGGIIQLASEGIGALVEREKQRGQAAAEEPDFAKRVVKNIPFFGGRASEAGEMFEREEYGRGIGASLGLGVGTAGGVRPTATGQALQTTGRTIGQIVARAPARSIASIRATGRAIAHPVQSLQGLVETGARIQTRYVSPEKQLIRAAQPGTNIPKAIESAPIAGSEMQRVRQRAGLEIRGEEAVPKAAKLAELTEKDIWNNEMKPRLKATGVLQADTQVVADAIRSKITPRMREVSPALAKSFERTAKFYEKNLPFEEIEGYIESANQELKGFYGTTDPKLTAGTSVKRSEVGALRKVFNDGVDRLTGPGTAEIKQRWGAVRDMRKALDRRVIVQARQKGVSLYEGLGMLGAGADLASAVLTFNTLPIKGAGTYLVGRSLARARDASFQLEQAFHGRNAFAASSPSAFQMPVRRALPSGPILAPGTSGTRLDPFSPYVAPGTRAERLGLLLKEAEVPARPIPLEGVPESTPAPFAPYVEEGTRASRLGLLLPEKAGGPFAIPPRGNQYLSYPRRRGRRSLRELIEEE